MNPNINRTYEEKVIRVYWFKWFASMKIEHFEIKTANLPFSLNAIIKDFILDTNRQ
ncbi:hypothetical protein [Flavobacterium sp. LB2R40]|uniref:hypothetical protein n=1 Tax=Flavobacterium sp. LB2R40 TaxID=3401722 RepID=UPI003AAF18A8